MFKIFCSSVLLLPFELDQEVFCTFQVWDDEESASDIKTLQLVVTITRPRDMARPSTGVPAVLVAALTLITVRRPVPVNGHGRLIEPPSRASMWRYGFDAPANYNDHELYCGGFSRQWQTNGGKCGICGDPWDLPQVY
jgi:hypothetical protein